MQKSTLVPLETSEMRRPATACCCWSL